MEVVSSNDLSNNDENTSMQYTWLSPTLRRVVLRLLNIPCAADYLPSVLAIIANNGKYAILGLLTAYLIFVSVCFPFWLLSFLITEWGVYALLIGTIFLIGRLIIRLLAFPGSSSRVSGEIEKEFSKYSIRMMTSAINAVIELATAISKLDSNSSNSIYTEIATTWTRVEQFRNRVLGLYYTTLVHVYNEQPIPSAIPPNSTPNTIIDAFGNNRLIGDIGNLSDITAQAQSSGLSFMNSLGQVLSELNSLENKANSLLNNVGRFVPKDAVNDNVIKTAQDLLQAASALKALLPSLSHDSSLASNDNSVSGSSSADSENVQPEGRSGMYDAARSTFGAIIPLIDPPPHTSVFGLDVLRGAALSRYKGASQLWIGRPNGGLIDAFHFQANGWDPSKGRNRKAVMYCNPNAGLIEVGTGMSLASGNCSNSIEDADDCCWTDFYTRKGYDVYLFNYAGFGRSRGTMKEASRGRDSGCFASLKRILNGLLFQFKPSPDTLRGDAVAVGTHLINELGIDSLIIHGESIGGMAAAGAAKVLTSTPSTADNISLLVCDRTFCNLQAVAQRLVGAWSGPAISALVPFWNTDVAGDFVAANCPKIVAQDHADAIIADAGSLRSGISLWKEIRGESNTKSIGWTINMPTEYLAADYEDVGVLESRISPSTSAHIQAPSWPSNQRISEKEALHFAACARRIGKLATSVQRANKLRSNSDDETGIELDFEGGTSYTQQGKEVSPIVTVWKFMSTCDGLCGALLGSAVKKGHDYTLTWLCCALTFGGQVVAQAAEKRLSSSPGAPFKITMEDFVLYAVPDTEYDDDDDDSVMYPQSIPNVIEKLKSLLETGGTTIQESVGHELSYCIGMLEYVVDRLVSSQVVERSRQGINFQNNSIGLFQNLTCGHNNLFKPRERVQLVDHLSKISSQRR